VQRALSLAVGITTVLVLATAGLTAVTTTTASASDPALAVQSLSLLNADRTSRGLPALTSDPLLTSIAAGWSDHLLALGSLVHNLALSSELPSGWTKWGENVGDGPSPQAVETAFMNSPPHRANILGAYDLVGVCAAQRADGIVFITIDFEQRPLGSVASSGSAPTCPSANPPATPVASAVTGYDVVGDTGSILSYGAAPNLGSPPGLGVGGRAVDMAATPGGRGYWVLTAAGGVYSFGDARFFGSLASIGQPGRAVALAVTPSGDGYWILAGNGSLYAFGDAHLLGSLATVAPGDEAVGMATTPSGGGYWILDSSGGVFTFGDAGYHGSLPASHVSAPAVAIAGTPSGGGYWILDASGGVFTFGDAGYHGSVPGIGCVTADTVAIAPTPGGRGYYVLANDGRIFAFGDAPVLGQPNPVPGSGQGLAVFDPPPR